jgi:CheY-like chemotaxis protein/signal transduction histidine kinase
MTGLDVISRDLFDCVQLIQNPTRITDQTRESLYRKTEEVISCVGNIRNTNHFMLMTINRCMDSTKASNGLKLIPKFETIDLKDALSLPLSCMANIQDKVAIKLLPYKSEDICSHIITDKQWLQENILCLLSNAVKYSAGGTVTISVSLQDRQMYDVSGSVMVSKSMSNDTEAYTNLTSPFCSSTTVLGTAMTGTIDRGNSDISQSSNNTNNNERHQSISFVADLPIFQKAAAVAAAATSGRRRCTVSASGSGRNSLSRSNGSFLSSFRQQVRSSITQQRDSSIVPTCTSNSFDLDDNRSHDGIVASQRGGVNFSSLASSRSTAAIANLINPEYTHLILFEIEDTGIGMSEEATTSLFSPFKQTQKLAGGTGLGLYSLAKRVEALKGHYGIRKRKDGKQGSLFWFTIPYRPDRILQTLAEIDSSPILGNYRKTLTGGSSSKRSLLVNPTDESNSYSPRNNSHADYSQCESGRISVVAVKSFQDENLLQRSFTSSAKSGKNSGRKAGQPIKGKSLNVLLAEDTPSIAKMTSLMLKRLGHHVTVVDNGQLAFNQIKQSLANSTSASNESSSSSRKNNSGRIAVAPYDVVLMDLQMPVMDGLEATRRIRAFEYSLAASEVHTLVIGVSAASDEETLKEGYAIGIDDFMPKPFTAAMFEAKMKELGLLTA